MSVEAMATALRYGASVPLMAFISYISDTVTLSKHDFSHLTVESMRLSRSSRLLLMLMDMRPVTIRSYSKLLGHAFHGQRDAPAVVVDFHHTYFDLLAHAHDFGRR